MMRLSEWVVGLSLITVAVLAVVLGGMIAPSDEEYYDGLKRGRVSQGEFLKVCHEDEVLMFYAGELDNAVCVNKDDALTYLLEWKE